MGDRRHTDKARRRCRAMLRQVVVILKEAEMEAVRGEADNIAHRINTAKAVLDWSADEIVPIAKGTAQNG